jgi:hypothetical protein
MPSILILGALSGTIAILAARLWYVSRKQDLEQARLAKARFADLRKLRLGSMRKLGSSAI